MANKRYASIEDLKKDSIRIYDGMTVSGSAYNGKEEKVNFNCATFNREYNGEKVYSSNNGTLAMIIDNNFYATPSTRSVLEFLEEEGFVEKFFYVPFSNGEYPVRERWIWEKLKAIAEVSNYEDFLEDCAKYCDEHGVGELDKSILSNALEIPHKGIRIKHLGFEDKVYPVINSILLDSYSAEKLGTYCCNNGRVVFITRDAKTYVTKGYKIIESLREAGYEEKSVFVPFSNGEEIIDSEYAFMWAQIKK